jgi:hypothetical protein
MRLVIGHWSLVIGFLLAAIPSAFADGGAVLSQATAGSYRITLFGSPSPLRAGPVDLSVMLQDAKTGEPVLDRPVTITVRAASNQKTEAWVPPCCSMKTQSAAVAATHAAAQNKLLYAANLILPASGPHDLVVQIGDLSAESRIDVKPPLSAGASTWPWLAAPPLLVGLFALNQRLRRRS